MPAFKTQRGLNSLLVCWGVSIICVLQMVAAELDLESLEDVFHEGYYDTVHAAQSTFNPYSTLKIEEAARKSHPISEDQPVVSTQELDASKGHFLAQSSQLPFSQESESSFRTSQSSLNHFRSHDGPHSFSEPKLTFLAGISEPAQILTKKSWRQSKRRPKEPQETEKLPDLSVIYANTFVLMGEKIPSILREGEAPIENGQVFRKMFQDLNQEFLEKTQKQIVKEGFVYFQYPNMSRKCEDLFTGIGTLNHELMEILSCDNDISLRDEEVDKFKKYLRDWFTLLFEEGPSFTSKSLYLDDEFRENLSKYLQGHVPQSSLNPIPVRHKFKNFHREAQTNVSGTGLLAAQVSVDILIDYYKTENEEKFESLFETKLTFLSCLNKIWTRRHYSSKGHWKSQSDEWLKKSSLFPWNQGGKYQYAPELRKLIMNTRYRKNAFPFYKTKKSFSESIGEASTEVAKVESKAKRAWSKTRQDQVNNQKHRKQKRSCSKEPTWREMK
ncbi:hypothetical protein O181_027090 [Austropuccinia psidii MF-1]|uniref:Uncharacterized protein n=1 Tax=Austropuccinia psidii MF-1 TaxID=1389203 RepID=A0A9Q3H2U8_9BASI|nr:hypothetical protein [Austropuccinia psidii MF-1]